MKAKNFIDYLKGAIELGNINSLKEKDIVLLSEKLSLIENEQNDAFSFCIWLKGFLDANDENEISIEKFKKIQTKLNSVNIDFTDKQKKTENKINPHSNQITGNSGSTLIRC